VIDYWLTQWLLSLAGWAYLALVSVTLALAALLPLRKHNKVVAIAIVLGFASILPIRAYIQYREEQDAVRAFKAIQEQALTAFMNRCKTVGETIRATATQVEAVRLLKVRPREVNLGDQFKLV